MKKRFNSFLLLSLLTLPLIVISSDDDDIEVIEGDGGVIKTAVEDDVWVLTRDNFDLQVMTKDIILVEFYAPWCGHCKSLEPEYAKAAKMLKHDKNPIPLAKVDATVETELSSRFEVNGFPTLYIFRKGEKELYDGPRTAFGIVEYMKERSDPNYKPAPEAVITLTSENFEETIKIAKIILVEFYAPWCGHCKQLAPEYERAAKALKNLPSPVPLAKVDGTVEKELAQKYDAKGWPTLMIFRSGRKYPYEGPRDESGIISYMKEQTKSPSQVYTSAKSLKNSLGKTDPTVVGFFDSDTDSFYEQYIEAANKLRGKFTFLHSFATDIRQQFGGFKDPKIVVFLPELFATDFEPMRFELDDAKSSSEDIINFVKKHSLSLVGERSHKSLWKYSDKYPLVVVYYDVDFSFDHRAQTQLIRKEVAKVAKDYKDRITFAVSNEEWFEEDLKQLNLDDSGEDINVVFYEAEGMRYRMDPVEDFSAEELRSFVEGVLGGQIPKHIKSQPVPKSNKGPVLTVVGKSFKELVLKSTQDVLLEFYAPWCGHCKKLEPVYKKLGKAFADNDRIAIAKIDATANDYPSEYKVSGFPTIVYIPANDKINYKTFNGERSLKELTKYVNEQLSNPQVKEEL